jgi:acetoacetate decarboxylase
MSKLKTEFNTDMSPSGMLWLYGRRPGAPEPYSGLFYQNMTLSLLTIVSTPESIRKVLPPPLEPIPDMPPVLFAFTGNARFHRGWNGRGHSYIEMGFWVPCQYKAVKGITFVFTYLGNASGDLTEGGELGAISGRELMGYMKRIGNVKLGGSDYVVNGSVDVRGTRIMDLHMEFDEEVSFDQLGVDMSVLQNMIFVKEIPNCTFSGYDVRKVICQKLGGFLGGANFVRKGTGSVKLGYLDTDPLNLIQVLNTGPAFQIGFDIPLSEGFSTAYEIEDLLKA